MNFLVYIYIMKVWIYEYMYRVGVEIRIILVLKLWYINLKGYLSAVIISIVHRCYTILPYSILNVLESKVLSNV